MENIKPIARKRDWICTTCGTVGKPKEVHKSFLFVEILLWVVFVWSFLTIWIPLAHSIWRQFSRRKICRSCRSKELIRATSPIGRQMVDIK